MLTLPKILEDILKDLQKIGATPILDARAWKACFDFNRY